MKGIFILSFHKKPGAFTDREYPQGITKQCNIDATEQNKVYSLHRMRNTKPNFLFVKAKGVQIASFYSGFDFKHYLGNPNQCVSIILEPSENPTKWEPYLRRLTYELLPALKEMRGNEIPLSGLSTDSKFLQFDGLLAEKLQQLESNTVEPLKEGDHEVNTGDTVVETISGMTKQTETAKVALTEADIQKATQLARQSSGSAGPTPEMDPIKAATMAMEVMEKDGLRNEIRKLHQMINERDGRVSALEAQVRDASCREVGGSNADISKMKGEYEAMLAAKEQELDTWRSKVMELNETSFINQDSIRKLTEMSMMQTDEAATQTKMIMDLKKKVKLLEANQSNKSAQSNPNAPIGVNDAELNSLRAHLTEVETTLKQKTQELETKSEKDKSNFMKAKKLENDNDTMRKTLEQKDKELVEARQALIGATGFVVQKGPGQDDSYKILELENNVKSLQKELAQAKANVPSVDPFTTDLTPRVKELEERNKLIEAENIDLKKTNKVQLREIENLQKLAGL